MSKRLNYKESRENVFKLIEKSSIISRYEIAKALWISFEDLAYTKPYYKFHNFLNYTRKYAFKEYFKAKKEMVSISNIFTLKSILDKNKLSISKLIQFCEIERIPLLYYVPQIKKYVFPNELLYNSIIDRLSVITIKGFIKVLKGAEIFGMYRNTDEVITFISQKRKHDIKEENDGKQYLIAFIRQNYIFGEKKEIMYKRLEFDKIIKEANKKIEENLYSITNLELLG